MGSHPRRPNGERGQKQTIVLLAVIAGLVLAMVIVAASQRFA
jgi:hypothetical protein